MANRLAPLRVRTFFSRSRQSLVTDVGPSLRDSVVWSDYIIIRDLNSLFAHSCGRVDYNSMGSAGGE
jgi:hypothetical protein